MLGTLKTGEGDSAHYEDTDDASPLGGFGYVRVRSKTNQETGVTTKSYIATWWYKVRARIEAESAQTKGQNLEWGTPTMILRAMGAYIDNSDKLKFRDRKNFQAMQTLKSSSTITQTSRLSASNKAGEQK